MREGRRERHEGSGREEGREILVAAINLHWRKGKGSSAKELEREGAKEMERARAS